VIAATLDLYRGFPSSQKRPVAIQVQRVTVTFAAAGTYLTCGRMLVDRERQDSRASTRSGIAVEHGPDGVWHVLIPDIHFDEPTVGDVEDVLSLILTEEWREAGWDAMHAGCVVSPDGDGLLLCAASGGGKSTLTAALVRSGWKTLGDDKLLVSRRSSDIFSLSRSFNLDPRSARWFSELNSIAMLPRYSAWTSKRRVFVESFWPGSLVWSAHALHIAKIVRDDSVDTWWVRRLTSRQVFSALLDQVVIPTDRGVARPVITTISRLAERMKGIELRLGNRAYETRDIAEALQAELK
jgi:predicted ATPase